MRSKLVILSCAFLLPYFSLTVSAKELPSSGADMPSYLEQADHFPSSLLAFQPGIDLTSPELLHNWRQMMNTDAVSGMTDLTLVAKTNDETASASVTPKSQEDWRLLSEHNMTEKLKYPEWVDQHKALVAKAQAGSSQLQFFGDSITAWISNESLDVFQKNFAKYNPENFGIPGDVTEELMWRLTHGELSGNPKAIVLMIGTNDMTVHRSKSAHAIASNIADIVKIIQAYEPTTKVLVMGILPRCSPQDPQRAELNEKSQQVNAEIAHLDDGNMVRFIDINSQFLDQKGLPRFDLLPDYLHPNHKGYETWSDAIKPTLDSMLN